MKTTRLYLINFLYSNILKTYLNEDEENSNLHFLIGC